jgi:hypothetical protein
MRLPLKQRLISRLLLLKRGLQQLPPTVAADEATTHIAAAAAAKEEAEAAPRTGAGRAVGWQRRLARLLLLKRRLKQLPVLEQGELKAGCDGWRCGTGDAHQVRIQGNQLTPCSAAHVQPHNLMASLFSWTNHLANWVN